MGKCNAQKLQLMNIFLYIPDTHFPKRSATHRFWSSSEKVNFP